MGIQHLNQFMRANCPDAIKQITLGQLRGKVIAVDTSIYMYRFAGEGILIEGMYQLISLFRHYEIVPMFIFDGKMPTEKNEILNIRREAKAAAEKKYDIVKERINSSNAQDDVRELRYEMDSLRKKFVRLRNTDIRNVKKLMDVCGVTYYNAEGEEALRAWHEGGHARRLAPDAADPGIGRYLLRSPSQLPSADLDGVAGGVRAGQGLGLAKALQPS